MKTSFKYMALGLGLLTMASCNDFLDREPKSDITPQAYFTSEADLAAYTINQYTFRSINNGSYGIGPFGDDNGTDNQAAMSASSFWAPGTWLVGQDAPQNDNSWGSPWNFTRIRQINYFFAQVMPKFNAGQIAGNTTNIRHYIGEAYVIRAYDYFTVLKTIGDAPIVTTALPDDKSTLIEASKREPSNKVARYILATLDTALTYLSETGPGGKNRVTKDVAYLLRSRVALYEGTWLKHHKGTAFVPGGPGWPGKAEDVQGFNIDSEINFFLNECMKSAKVVGDKLVGNLVKNTDTKEGFDKTLKELNPYYGMFCNPDMNGYSEVLMWRSYNVSENITHNIQMQLIRNGGGSGWTRGLVNSFLMRNGLPIYAAGSGYNPDWEKEGVKATLQDRDSRIQQFTKKDGDVEFYTYAGEESYWNPIWMVEGATETKNVTGFALKRRENTMIRTWSRSIIKVPREALSSVEQRPCSTIWRPAMRRRARSMLPPTSTGAPCAPVPRWIPITTRPLRPPTCRRRPSGTGVLIRMDSSWILPFTTSVVNAVTSSSARASAGTTCAAGGLWTRSMAIRLKVCVSGGPSMKIVCWTKMVIMP